MSGDERKQGGDHPNGDSLPASVQALQAALARTEIRMRLLADHHYDGLTILDREGRIQQFNPSSEHPLGHGPGELEGRHWQDVVQPEDIPAAQAAFQDALAHPGRPYARLVRMRHKDGSPRDMDVTAVSMFDVPAVNGLVVHARDATLRRKLEQQLRRSQKLEALGQIAAGLAHDLNNLVHVASGYTSAVLDGLPAKDAAAADLSHALAALERAGALTSRLLQLGRPTPERRESVDVNTWAAQLLRLVERSLGRRVRMRFLPGSNVPLVNGDAGLLDQVLLNLCLNARDAMPQGGTLTVSSQAVMAPLGAPEGSAAWACLTVADTGPGMPADVLPRIFEPFFTTKSGTGTGLGLSTSRAIVEQHGGELRVESVLGAGATFRILLPPAAAYPRASAGTPVAGSAALPPEPGQTVLIADDDEAVRVLLTRILERRGFRVLSAAGGQEALARFGEAKAPVALALLDVSMPDLSGLDTARRMRERDPGLPVLLCTAYAANTVNVTALAGAPTEVLTKPYSPAALLHHVFALVAARKAQGQD